VTESSVAWGDYDNDGDLDILLTGRAGGGNEVSMLYRNDDCLPALEISKMVGDGNPLPGQGLEYTIVVSNSGVADATGAVISDTLPAEMVFAGPVTLDPPGAGIVGTPPTVLHDATIGAGGKISVTFAVTVSMCVAPGAVTNTAAVHCSEVPAPVEASVPITVANARPALGTVDPSSGSGMTGVMTYFSTTWTDNNGWQDLKQCYFHIGDSPSLVGNVTLMYNAAKDKLWMRSDDGTVWFGGHAPGTPFIMQNGRAIVHCSLTTAQGAGDTLTMTWAIQFKPGFEGTKKLGLKCKDRSKAKAKGKWKGTWTITPWRM
jgi:uncharacterized repeat protein (TIGR01451 family)